MVKKSQTIVNELDVIAQRHRNAPERVARSVSNAFGDLVTVGRKLLPQIQHWLDTGKVASGKILHVGFPQARSIGRNKPGKKVEFGLQYLVGVLTGGYLFVRNIERPTGEVHMPKLALAAFREDLGPGATPDLFVYDRGGWSKENATQLRKEGVKKVGIQPKGKARWRVHGTDRQQTMSERGKSEGKIGTLKSSYGFNKPRERRPDTLLAAGQRSALAFNLRKLIRHIANATKLDAIGA